MDILPEYITNLDTEMAHFLLDALMPLEALEFNPETNEFTIDGVVAQHKWPTYTERELEKYQGVDLETEAFQVTSQLLAQEFDVAEHHKAVRIQMMLVMTKSKRN